MSQHWPEIARRWSLVGPPLRPCDADVATYREAVGRWQGEGPLRALILGVTPELYRMDWPAATDLIAVDHTLGMIEAVWPGPREQTRCAEWTQLPFADASRDVALCDGGLHLLDYPIGQTQLARELKRVIAPSGLCIFRLFIPPRQPEHPANVFADLMDGAVANVNELKMRLAMSLQTDATTGVQLGSVWHALNSIAADLDLLARTLGWDYETLAAIETYRNSEVRYHFVSLEQAAELFDGFSLESVVTPTYHLGERCPFMMLRRS